MKKIVVLLLSLVLFASVAYNVASAADISTEEKFNSLKKEGIFTGYPDGSSKLYNAMSREEFAVVLYRVFELADSPRTKSFDDVERNRWSFTVVEAVNKSGLMVGDGRKFSPENNVTVEQLAAILVRATGYESRSSGFVTGTVSTWARGAVRTALDNDLIDKADDYTAYATRGQLVEAIYAIFKDLNEPALTVMNVEAVSNRELKVTLFQPATKVEDKRFTLVDLYGNKIRVGVSSVSRDGRTITLWTDRMFGGVPHTLTVDGGSPWGFISYVEDTTKPQLQSVTPLNNRTVEVIFNEAVDKASAENEHNYRFNNGLRVQDADLTTDRKVLLTTNEQQDGWSYELTIRGVKDKSDNALDQVTRSISSDYNKPTVTSVQVNNTAVVTVKFNEKINPDDAKQTNRYAIDKGLAVTQATLESDGKTVSLRTAPQQDGVLYKLTVSDIRDLAGNRMDTSTNWKFGGIANPEIPVRLQWIKAVNNNTVEVGFSRSITDQDIANLKAYILKDNGANVSMDGWNQYALRKDDKSATIQFRTKASGDPKLFNPGHYYLARVSGAASLLTSDAADELEFAGTNVDNPPPYVTEVKAIDKGRVKVSFSEPVTNVDEAAFTVKQLDGKLIEIEGDELNNRNALVWDVVLKLDQEMVPGWEYRMTFNEGVITDASRWNGLKTKNGNDPIAIVYSARW
ncbi:Ig-like domain-containing protein [Cohnella panacarvi]|uniref:Ig-like domain-containing protein n=1 Tax=Cohnella panacarvi TaxID=400776 RepID=UPI00047DFA18|nr:Ig-like domain-containing protein [Cohnella panacarvi]